MTTARPTAPTPATEANTRSRNSKKTVGTAIAAVTLVAATVLGGPGLIGGTAAGLDPASIIGSPTNSVSSRLAGVHEDMARAVQLKQVTPEQASFLENQLVKRIQNQA
ncbi:hypothetical protein [Arthrobacter antibioticus]|uniref:hypothetical protein n=1 Tax=Arthrobacter sp. H35-MC1 TaxID=3046203 RepID=UPI0024BA6EE4|nr:hypothetical protein [Arthrobacter sp. H35-MC1]MDJ0316953.1 hypothetical protein [Arthrobacter sp. H35-MC1]